MQVRRVLYIPSSFHRIGESCGVSMVFDVGFGQPVPVQKRPNKGYGPIDGLVD